MDQQHVKKFGTEFNEFEALHQNDFSSPRGNKKSHTAAHTQMDNP